MPSSYTQAGRWNMSMMACFTSYNINEQKPKFIHGYVCDSDEIRSTR